MLAGKSIDRSTLAANAAASHLCAVKLPGVPDPVQQAVNAFLRWLEGHGYASYDPYDVWGSPYALLARRAYYQNSGLGLPLIAPILLMEILWPGWRALWVRKERYATADAQLLLAFLNLYEVSGETIFLAKAKGLAADLVAHSLRGYSGLCWGYPFDWQNVNGLAPKNTPFITIAPYCFEAFLQLFDATGQTDYFESARSAVQFVRRDLKDTPVGDNATAGSYSPVDQGKVINASAYRAMVLFEAARRFNWPGDAEKAAGNLRFILQSQRADGSWLYSADNPKEAFIDHFHTCFVLKNLCKINVHLQDPAVKKAIQNGYGFYRRELFDAAGQPKSFAVEPRTQITRLEMYNVAEAITLGVLLRQDLPEAFALAGQLADNLSRNYQCADGHFVTRVYLGGWRHTLPFLRWPQAQLFHALTNLLKAHRGRAPLTARALAAEAERPV
jgi:hypothetical protein